MFKLRAVLSSRFGWYLASAAVFLCVTTFKSRPTSDVGYYEGVYASSFVAERYLGIDSPLELALCVTHMVPLSLSQGISKLWMILFPTTAVETLSWIHAAHLLLLILIQWLIVGSFIELIAKSHGKTPMSQTL